MVALVAIVATDSTLMQVVAAGMAIGALYVALLRPGKRSLEAVNCARQLGDLTDEWKSLWRQVNGSEAEDETAPLALRALSARTNAVTAPLAQERVDKKILRTTEEKTYAYWKEIAGSDTGSTDTRKAIAASPEEAIATT
ncbi:MAG: hypothetical protein F4Z87_07295 [Gammaproteobacteria bacterium]|nr:hypothetical protein [Gammaproteobacteria bacterium]